MTTSVAPFQRSPDTQEDFASIALLRAIAAMWVLVAHCMIWGGWHNFYHIGIPNPKVAVDLFMVISGFLMVSLAERRAASEDVRCKRGAFLFVLRRFFRIAPAYYLSLSIAVTCRESFLSGYSTLQSLNPGWWPAGGVYDPARIEYNISNILLHVTFFFGMLPDASFSTFLPDWSLSLEMQFYVAFPLIYVVLGRAPGASVLVLACTLMVWLGLEFFEYAKFAEPSLLPMKLNFFLAGMLLAKAMLNVRCERPWFSFFWGSLVLASLGFHYSLLSWVLPVACVLVFVCEKDSKRARTPTLLQVVSRTKAVKFASDLSYGVYLFHGFFISMFGTLLAVTPWMQRLLPTHRVGLMVAFVSVCTYCMAFVVHRAVEVRGVRLGAMLARAIARRGE